MSFLFPSTTITFDAALRDVVRGSPRARAAAAHALGEVTDDHERRRAVEALTIAIEDSVPQVRAEAAASLGELADGSVVPLLVKRLTDGEQAVREAAAIALGTLRHPDGFAPLLEALRTGSPDLRFQAASSLAEIDPRRAFDPLLAALHDRDPQVVGAVALSLGAIPPVLDDRELAVRARTALVEQLDQPSEGARFDVAYALAELGDASGRQILGRAITDNERAWDAVTAIAKLGDRELLARVLAQKGAPAEPTVLAAGRLLALGDGSSSETAQRVLLAALTVRKTNVRGLAVDQLAEVGGSWAIAPLESLARSNKGFELRDQIRDAIAAIRGRS